MKKHCIAVLLAVICVLGVGTGARAQESEDTVIATVPHDFVVAGLVLPSGKYRVSRIDSVGGSHNLEIRNVDNGRATVLVIPTVFDDARKGDPHIDLRHVGGTYFLSGIETLSGTYSINIGRSAISVAQAKDNNSGQSSGTN